MWHRVEDFFLDVYPLIQAASSVLVDATSVQFLVLRWGKISVVEGEGRIGSFKAPLLCESTTSADVFEQDKTKGEAGHFCLD